MAGVEQMEVAQAIPRKGRINGQHAAELLGRKGQERIEGDREVGRDLQGDVEDRLHPCGIGGEALPRLSVREVLVADASQVHGLTLGIAEMERVEQTHQLSLYGLELMERSAIIVIHLATFGHDTVEVFTRQHECTVDEVAEDGHQLVVVAGLEVFPRKVVVLRLGRVGGKHIAEHILLARQIVEVFVEPYSTVLRRRDLVALEVQELVSRHIVRQDERPFGAEHGREDDAVEDDVVLADEVQHTRLWILPPCLPASVALGLRVTQLLRVTDVADRRIKPDVEHLAFGALDRHGNTPVQIATDGARLQPHVEPALALSVDVWLPLLVLLEDPLAEERLVLVERQVPVLRATHHGRASADGRAWIDQLRRAERRTATLALVAISVLVATVGAGAGDIAVGEELSGLLVVVLITLLL